MPSRLRCFSYGLDVNVQDYPRAIRETYAAHVVLSVGCGVDMENLFVIPALAPDGSGECIGVMAKIGDFEFVVTCGPYGMSKQEFGWKWTAFIREINAAAPSDREAMQKGTWALDNATRIIAAYVKKRGHRG